MEDIRVRWVVLWSGADLLRFGLLQGLSPFEKIRERSVLSFIPLAPVPVRAEPQVR